MRAVQWDDFAGAEGGAYRVRHGETDVQLTLEKVAELSASGREGGSFRLEFRGPAEPLLGQAIYPFSRDGETFDIFIVPVGRDDRGTLYEAVFF